MSSGDDVRSSTTCTACGTALPGDGRFCPSCGTPAVRRCAVCRRPLAADHRFCAGCGTPVADSAAAGSHSGPSSGAPHPAQAERRVSSVLFGDLVGFTALSETRDPEEVRELLSGYFDRCRDVVARYGGTIEKFIGDAVMAVWGVPAAHEDDAERAVRAGLDLVDAVAEYGERLGAHGLAMRVGVVTGEVAVTLGAVNQGMVAGDSVNTAARVQAKADPGSVWVDDETRALTSAAIGYEPVGAHELKGKLEPVALHRATAVMGVLGGVGRELGVEAPLVGRRRELSLLKDVYQAAVEDGRGRLLVVAGAPGVGKSRLGWELQKYTDGLSAVIWWHWGRCAAYGDGVAFSALSAAVRRRIGTDDGAPPAAQREQLRTHVAEIAADPAEAEWLEPRLAVLLGGKHDYSHEDLFAAWLTWFERISRGRDPVVWVIDDAHYADDALLDFVEHLVGTARFPLLVVLLARQELLDRRPRLAVSRRGTVIGLEGLSEGPMGELFDALVVDLPPRARKALVASSEGVPLYAVETVRAMLDRGLLVEEDGRRRLAPGVDAGRLADIGAPTSLQLLIASRLDALPPRLRELAQYASVLGNSFTLDGLVAVSGRSPEEASAEVQELAARDLITRVADRFSPDFGRYAFVQAMVRQVAYRTQSRQNRLDRHLAAAEYLQHQAETSGELVVFVAQHLGDALSLLAADDPRAPHLRADLVHWLERSGQRASSLGAPAEAMSFYAQALEHADDAADRARLAVLGARAANDSGHNDRALSLASAVLDTEPLDLRAQAATIRADAHRRLGHPDLARAELEPFLGAIDDISAGTASTLLRICARTMAELGDAATGRGHAEQALKKAEQAGDSSLISWALNDIGTLAVIVGLPRLAMMVFDGAIAYGETHHVAGPAMVVSLNRAVSTVSFDLREAMRFSHRALEQVRQTNHSWGVLLTLTCLEMTQTMAGRWDETIADEDLDWVIEPLLEAIPIFRALVEARHALRDLVRGMPLSSPLAPVDESLLEDVRRDLGQEVALIRLVRARTAGGLRDLAVELAESAVGVANPYGGSQEWYPFLWSRAVDWLIESGTAEDLATARRAVEIVDRAPGTRNPALAAQLPRMRATLAMAEGGAEGGADHDAVERDLREAIDALEAYGAVPDRARAQLLLGRCLAEAGRPAEAAPLLAAARSTFAELGMVVEQIGSDDAALSRTA